MNKNDLLPLVDADVGHSVANSLTQVGDNELKWWKKEVKNIAKINPVIAEFINRWSNVLDDECKLRCIICGVLVYKLLESQAEANLMSQEYKLG